MALHVHGMEHNENWKAQKIIGAQLKRIDFSQNIQEEPISTICLIFDF